MTYKEGDKLAGENGKIHRVMGVYYDILFSDGSRGRHPADFVELKYPLIKPPTYSDGSEIKIGDLIDGGIGYKFRILSIDADGSGTYWSYGRIGGSGLLEKMPSVVTYFGGPSYKRIEDQPLLCDGYELKIGDWMQHPELGIVEALRFTPGGNVIVRHYNENTSSFSFFGLHKWRLYEGPIGADGKPIQVGDVFKGEHVSYIRITEITAGGGIHAERKWHSDDGSFSHSRTCCWTGAAEFTKMGWKNRVPASDWDARFLSGKKLLKTTFAAVPREGSCYIEMLLDKELRRMIKLDATQAYRIDNNNKGFICCPSADLEVWVE